MPAKAKRPRKPAPKRIPCHGSCSFGLSVDYDGNPQLHVPQYWVLLTSKGARDCNDWFTRYQAWVDAKEKK